MTVREIADIAGVSPETVRAKTKELFPGKIKNGKRTVFLQKEAVVIMAELRKKGFVQPTENLELPTENVEVVTRSDLATFGASIVTEIMKQFLPLLQNQHKQIEIAQDYYTIKGYASKLGQQILFSEALNLGRLAGKISREKGLEIRKVDDERFGIVNSYSIIVLKEVFQI